MSRWGHTWQRLSRPPARRALATTLAAAAVTLAVGTSRPAAAQPEQASGFALDRFAPSGGGSAWFSLESLDFRATGRPAVGLVGDWAYKPLVVYDVNANETGSIVEQQLFLHFGLAINLFDRVRLGASLPLAVDQRGSAIRTTNGLLYRAPGGAGVGDLRLAADLRLLGSPGGPLVLAIGSQLFLPTGDSGAYTGDARVRVAPRVMLAGELGPLAWAARGGIQLRPRPAAGFPEIGDQVEAAAALGLRPVPAILIGPEVFAATTLHDDQAFEPRATPIEVLVGAHLRLFQDWHLGVGAAPGLTDGLGSPRFRVVMRLEYFPAIAGPADRDGDGILDEADACPTRRGPRTADPATSGCPPRDRDGDGILDDADACPDQPGPRTGDRTTNGCPADRDSDGVADAEDACPDAPGIPTADPKTNGCPGVVDRDGDGVPDGDDACPDIPGKKTDSPKTNGCADRDMDGVFDPEDACPDAPGPSDRDRSKNGCPAARVQKGRIRIAEQVKFQSNSAEILPESERVLQAVAKIFQENPELKKVRVEGHTDNRGSAAHNKRLSERRAAAVVKWLVDHGVDSSRLSSTGHGRDRPIATNRTEEGRQENRRVELHIVDPPPAPEPQ